MRIDTGMDILNVKGSQVVMQQIFWATDAERGVEPTYFRRWKYRA
jgi:hypothetical protein